MIAMRKMPGPMAAKPLRIRGVPVVSGPCAGLFGAPGDLQSARRAMTEDSSSHPFEQPVGKRVVEWSAAVGHRSNVGAGPDEAIEFGDDDPASVAVEAELLLRIRWNFYSVGALLWRRVGDGCHQDQDSGLPFDSRHDDHGRPVLAAAFLADRGFPRPEIGVGY